MSEAPPPEIPPPEMPDEALSKLIDEGNIEEIENALREQLVRLPAVLRELDRVLEAGLGNLATVLVTTLIARFNIARADKLADRVLEQRATAGTDELVDLGAALLQQERLSAATRALSAALEQNPKHDRALYFTARIAARRGHIETAFEKIAKVSPKLLGGAGLSTQARYAGLLGREKAQTAALKLARKFATQEEQEHLRYTEGVLERLKISGANLQAGAFDLRTAFALEYGSLLVELARDESDGGRFGMDPMKFGDIGPLLERMIKAIRTLGIKFETLLYATEDGEIIAAAVSERTELPYREWRAEHEVNEGDWLCMASAATHPHMQRAAVQALQSALDKGVLKTLAMILPCGWRGPMVPDVIGRVTSDDELPWAIDDEVDETVELIFDEREDRDDDARQDAQVLEDHIERFSGVLRATQPAPRAPHVPFLDETPIPRS